MSIEHTAEDFAKASFARHRDGGKAVRFDAATDGPPWQIGMLGKSTDEYMARNGWVPVVEADGPVVTEHTLRHVEERAERKRERLIRHVSDLEGTIRRRGAAMEDLREKLADAERRAELAEWTQDKIAGEANDLRQEIDRLERILQAPLSMKDLEVAWEAAEVPTDGAPIRSGDVVIEKISAGAYAVMSPPPTCGLVGREFRVLSRAPREPWQDLADSLEAEVQWIDRFNAVDAAQALHAAGWRKGGGES